MLNGPHSIDSGLISLPHAALEQLEHSRALAPCQTCPSGTFLSLDVSPSTPLTSILSANAFQHCVSRGLHVLAGWRTHHQDLLQREQQDLR